MFVRSQRDVDRGDVTTRRPALPFASPDHGPHRRRRDQLVEDLEEPGVHVVVERVVFLGVVVGDRGDGAVDLEPDLVGHPVILADSPRRSTSERLR